MSLQNERSYITPDSAQEKATMRAMLDNVNSSESLTFGFRVFGYLPASAPKSSKVRIEMQKSARYK